MARTPKGRTDGLQWGEGTIVDQPNGKYLARWWEPAPDGGPKQKRGRVFTTQDEAQDFLRKMFRQVRTGSYTPPSELTVQQVIDKWLARGASRWKPATQASYRQRAYSRVIPYLGRLKVESLTTHRIQDWIDTLADAGLDASTIDTAYRVLNGALKQAQKIGVISSNPAPATTRPPIQLKPVDYWNEAEIAAVMRGLVNEPMWTALYRIAVTTGMRPGELRGLKWRDVDLEKRVLVINRTMTKDAAGLAVMGTTTKTGRSRVNVLTERAAKDLAAWRTAQKARQLAAPVWHKEDLIFDRGDGRFLPQTTWQKFHARLVARTGVRDINFHGLRHTNATLDMEAGVHPKIVSERLGHRNIQTTLDRYSHVSVDLQRAAAEALDRRLFGDAPDDADATTNAR